MIVGGNTIVAVLTLTREAYIGGVCSAGKNSDEAGIPEGSRIGEGGSREYVLMAGPTPSPIVFELVLTTFLLFELLLDPDCFEVALLAVLLLLLLECPECPDPGLETFERLASSEYPDALLWELRDKSILVFHGFPFGGCA